MGTFSIRKSQHFLPSLSCCCGTVACSHSISSYMCLQGCWGVNCRWHSIFNTLEITSWSILWCSHSSKFLLNPTLSIRNDSSKFQFDSPEYSLLLASRVLLMSASEDPEDLIHWWKLPAPNPCLQYQTMQELLYIFHFMKWRHGNLPKLKGLCSSAAMPVLFWLGIDLSKFDTNWWRSENK